MPTLCPDERSAQPRVEATVNSIQRTLAALLPVLWLVAGGQSMLAFQTEYGAPRSCASQHAFQGDKRCPSQHLPASDAAATLLHSRLAKYPVKGSLASCKHTPRSCSIQPLLLTRRGARRTLPDLATSGQFPCRAALDPRPPSFGS